MDHESEINIYTYIQSLIIYMNTMINTYTENTHTLCFSLSGN